MARYVLLGITKDEGVEQESSSYFFFMGTNVCVLKKEQGVATG